MMILLGLRNDLAAFGALEIVPGAGGLVNAELGFLDGLAAYSARLHRLFHIVEFYYYSQLDTLLINNMAAKRDKTEASHELERLFGPHD